MTGLRRWWLARSQRRDKARRCRDTHHVAVNVPATPTDLAQGRRPHRVVCQRCGRRLA